MRVSADDINMENKIDSVLVVDDDPAIHRMIGRILKRHSLSFFSVYNGLEAIENIDSMAPDVILLDLSMPRMDGFEVARRIKSDPGMKDIPILILTGKNCEDVIENVLGSCADDFIPKTASPSELIARVKYHLKRKHVLERLHSDQKTYKHIISDKSRKLESTQSLLHEASLEVIWRLTAASEFRDNETGAHIRRMSHYAFEIARAMGLKTKAADTILYAATMHDIGKIGIPDNILLKADKLSPAEWDIMKRHTSIGASILKGSRIGIVKMGEVIALTHHEKWDGSGYPNGLRGRQIPLAGRIVAVADVFDALTSKRPYKEPFTLEKSNKIILEGRDRHFDPDVVDVFFAIQGKILEIKERYKDEQELPFLAN